MTTRSICIVALALVASACTFKVIGETPELEPPKAANSTATAGSTHHADSARAGTTSGGTLALVLGASAKDSDASAGTSAFSATRPGTGGDSKAGAGGSAGVSQAGSTMAMAGKPGSAGHPALGGSEASGGQSPASGTRAFAGSSNVAGNAAMAGSAGVSAAPDWSIVDRYVTAGSWHGFAWGYLTDDEAGSISATITNNSLCAKGVMNADDDYQLNAGVAFHLDQDRTVPSGETSYPTRPWSVPSGGVTVHFTNPGGSILRMFLGNSNTKQYFCVELTALSSPVTVAWTDFNSSCWDGSGSTLPLGAEMLTFGLFAQSLADRSANFDFCLDRVRVNR